MLCKAQKPTMLSHGNHNNIHFRVGVGGTKRRPAFSFKVVCFFDTEEAYILNSNIRDNMKCFLNYELIESLVAESIAMLDYTFVRMSTTDLFNRNIKTHHILNKLINIESDLKNQ